MPVICLKPLRYDENVQRDFLSRYALSRRRDLEDLGVQKEDEDVKPALPAPKRRRAAPAKPDADDKSEVKKAEGSEDEDSKPRRSTRR